MIGGVAFCPHPPLLLPEFTGRQVPSPPLLAACRHAVEGLLAGVEVVVVVTGHPAAPTHSLQPLGFRVAARLLADAGWEGPVERVAVPFEEPAAQCAETGRRAGRGLRGRPEHCGVLVMADGSARRGPTAPGHLDPRALVLDERFVAAVRSGEAAALGELDADLAAQVWFQGRAALGVLSGMLAGGPAPVTDLPYVDDVFGVQYVVALWGFEPALGLA